MKTDNRKLIGRGIGRGVALMDFLLSIYVGFPIMR